MMNLTEFATDMRANLKIQWESIKIFNDYLKKWQLNVTWEDCDKWEAIANLTLSYRHLEDSVMRLWKVIQADAWGVNIYDKPPVN